MSLPVALNVLVAEEGPLSRAQLEQLELELGENGKQCADTRILIVEDDPVSALLLRKILEHRGYSVDHAEHGREALELFTQTQHRVLISDWMMPEMDGVKLCREIRNSGGAYVYVILLSAKGQRADRLEAFEAGVDDFLTKPLDREELFARLKVAHRIIGAEEKLEQAGARLREANKDLLVASRRFEELFKGMPMACFTFENNGLVREWNRAAESTFGVSAPQALHTVVWNVFRDTSGGFWSQELVARVFGGESFEGREWVFRGPSASPRHIVTNVFPLRGAGGEHLGAISANLDITERKIAERQIKEQKAALEEANERLATLAVTDGLTGLHNHRRFQEELEATFTEHSASGRPMSLLFLDVDHFKQYNDAYGHPAGDILLKKLAVVLRSVARRDEAVARYGGEEFAIILANTDAAEAVTAAERFRKAIANSDWPHRPVTASVGVSTRDVPRDAPVSLITRADAALYAAKQAGRNRVMHERALGDSSAAA